MESIAVYCASSPGNDPDLIVLARETGALLAKRGIRVVYGGGRIGLMGALADAALEAGGEVVGVIPGFLRTKEVAHEGVTNLVEVETMHERKLRMLELSDGFITLPGGYGTMEEFFEVVTWAQLGLHRKPIGLVNFKGYYDTLLAQFNRMENEGLLKSRYRGLVIASRTPNELLRAMDAYHAPAIPRWLDEKDT